MGVERSVTRWYVQRQLLLAEIELQSAKVLPVQDSSSEEGKSDIEASEAGTPHEAVQQFARTQEKLHLLGPCPKPMMG